MTETFTSAKFPEVAQLTIEAAKWLQEQGIRIENTRIERYITDMQRLARDFENKALFRLSAEELSDYDDHMRESLFEASDLITIYNGLQNNVTDGLREKLRSLVKGPVSFPKERSNSNQPRNIAFELMTAAYFEMSKMAPFFTGDADLSVTAEGTKVVVECKRPQNYASIKPRMREALKQIDTRVTKSGEGTVGIAALDITKTLNPDHRQIKFFRQADFDRILGNICSDYFRRLHEEWKLHKHPNAIGVLMRVCGLGVSNEVSRYTYYQEFVFFGFTGQGKHHDKVLETLVKAFESSREG